MDDILQRHQLADMLRDCKLPSANDLLPKAQAAPEPTPEPPDPKIALSVSIVDERMVAIGFNRPAQNAVMTTGEARSLALTLRQAANLIDRAAKCGPKHWEGKNMTALAKVAAIQRNNAAPNS